MGRVGAPGHAFDIDVHTIQSNPVFFTCTVAQFEFALINLRELYEREVTMAGYAAAAVAGRRASKQMHQSRENSMLSSPIDVDKSGLGDGGDGFSSSEEDDFFSSDSDEEEDDEDEEEEAASAASAAAAATTEHTDNDNADTKTPDAPRRARKRSSIPVSLSHRVVHAYVQCFRDAGIDQLHLLGFLQKSVESHAGALANAAAEAAAATAVARARVDQLRQRDDALDPLLDPEDVSAAGLTPSKHLITLIQENARLAHLLRTKTQAEEKAMARNWPAMFPEDGDSRGLDYFAPSLKVFSEMLDHDLRAAAERSLNAFSLRTGAR